MARPKKTTAEKLSAKGKEFMPFHITVEFRDHPPQPGKYKMLIIKIRECPKFHMYFCTWEMNPTHFGHVNWGNVELSRFKGHTITEPVGTSEIFAKEMSMPAENWGSDVPDDVRFFIKDSFMEYLTDMKSVDNGWSTSEKRVGFPLSAVPKLIEKIQGVCMARTKKGRIIKEIKEEIEIDESLGDASQEVSDD